jgi:hypothetical protein
MNPFVLHPTITWMALYFLFSAVVSGMPVPTEKSSLGYTWFFHSSHLLAGNLQTVVATKYPALPSGSVQVSQTVTAVPEEKH